MNYTGYQYQNLSLGVVKGDIAKVPADSLITLLTGSDSRYWLGGVDEAIRRVGGEAYHTEAAIRSIEHSPAYKQPKPEVIVIDCLRFPYESRFESIVFVVDDLKLKLSALILGGLVKAQGCAAHTVSLPLMRTGSSAGNMRLGQRKAVGQLVTAVRAFASQYPGYVMKISLVHNGESAVVDSIWRDLLFETRTTPR